MCILSAKRIGDYQGLKGMEIIPWRPFTMAVHTVTICYIRTTKSHPGVHLFGQQSWESLSKMKPLSLSSPSCFAALRLFQLSIGTPAPEGFLLHEHHPLPIARAQPPSLMLKCMQHLLAIVHLFLFVAVLSLVCELSKLGSWSTFRFVLPCDRKALLFLFF